MCHMRRFSCVSVHLWALIMTRNRVYMQLKSLQMNALCPQLLSARCLPVIAAAKSPVVTLQGSQDQFHSLDKYIQSHLFRCADTSLLDVSLDRTVMFASLTFICIQISGDMKVTRRAVSGKLYSSPTFIPIHDPLNTRNINQEVTCM